MSDVDGRPVGRAPVGRAPVGRAPVGRAPVGRAPVAGRVGSGDAVGPSTSRPYDPLRLCVYATIALLGWLGGPVTVLVFAGIGFAGYLSARRAGLTRSKCFLRDTRLVLAYLGALGVAGGVGIWLRAVEAFG